MGLVHAYKKGEVPASKVSQAVKDAAKSMKKKSTKKFASTKHDDLPNKVRSENMNEDGHTDVASAERKLKLIMKDAMDTLNGLRSLSNEDSLPSWWTDKITLAKDYVGKSRDYIMNPAESVNEGNLDKTASTLVADLNKEFIRYNPKKSSDFVKVVKYLGKKMPRVPKSKIEDIAMTFDEIMRDEAGNVVVNSREQRARMKTTLKKLGMKESVNEGISVSDERHFGKKGIIIMIDDNGKKVSAIFKDKKNAKEFNRNKPADIKKLLQLAKKTKYPKAIDESVNETPQKVAKLLIKYGNNTKDVKDMIKKHYKTAKKDRSKSTPSELANYISFLSANESVNEGKGVEKILKMADEKSFGKIAGRTVDGMTAGLFKAVYDKAPQNAKDKIDKMSEKQLYVFMGKLWNKFGRQVKLS